MTPPESDLPRLHPTCPHGFEVGDSTECTNPECWPVRDATTDDALPFRAAFEDGVNAACAWFEQIIKEHSISVTTVGGFSVGIASVADLLAAIRGGE